MDKLNIYNDSTIILEKNIPKKIISWVTILVILIILFIIFCFIPFNIYKPINGYVDIVDNKSYIILTLNKSDFPFYKNNKLYIKSKRYDYSFVTLKDNKIILNIDLDDNLKIQNNIITVNILKNRTTLYNLIKNKIKKGFDV